MPRTRLAVLVAALGTVWLSSAFAAESDLATIEAERAKRLSMPPGGCACITARAGNLKDGQQAFIAAALTKNKPLQQEIMQTLTVGELTEAGMFMTNAPAQCAKGG